MKLVLNPEEFQEVRNMVGNTKHRSVISGFNSIFTEKSKFPVRGVVLPKSNDIIIEMHHSDAIRLIKTLSISSEEFGTMIKQDLSITAVPKWISFFKKIGANIKKIF